MDAKYNSRWQKAREGHLRSHPLCVDHLSRGMTVAATVVDHKVPHRGDSALFWDRDNWQSLCKPCHDGWKQRQERGGVAASCDLAGLPTDPRHPWLLPAPRPAMARTAPAPGGWGQTSSGITSRPALALSAQEREMEGGGVGGWWADAVATEGADPHAPAGASTGPHGSAGASAAAEGT